MPLRQFFHLSPKSRHPRPIRHRYTNAAALTTPAVPLPLLQRLPRLHQRELHRPPGHVQPTVGLLFKQRKVRRRRVGIGGAILPVMRVTGIRARQRGLCNHRRHIECFVPYDRIYSLSIQSGIQYVQKRLQNGD